MFVFMFMGLLSAAVVLLGAPVVAYELMLETCRQRAREQESSPASLCRSHNRTARGEDDALAELRVYESVRVPAILY